MFLEGGLKKREVCVVVNEGRIREKYDFRREGVAHGRATTGTGRATTGIGRANVSGFLWFCVALSRMAVLPQARAVRRSLVVRLNFFFFIFFLIFG